MDNDDDSSDPPYAIIGAAAGGAILIMGACCVWWRCCRPKKRQPEETYNAAAPWKPEDQYESSPQEAADRNSRYASNGNGSQYDQPERDHGRSRTGERTNGRDGYARTGPPRDTRSRYEQKYSQQEVEMPQYEEEVPPQGHRSTRGGSRSGQGGSDPYRQQGSSSAATRTSGQASVTAAYGVPDPRDQRDRTAAPSARSSTGPAASGRSAGGGDPQRGSVPTRTDSPGHRSATGGRAPSKGQRVLESVPVAAVPQAQPRPGSEDEEDEADQLVGPTAQEEVEPIDAQQRATLQEVHLQQIAGITDMIQGVKDNLMQQQSLKHDIKQDTSLEVYEKIGGGGFGEVFKGSFQGQEVAVKIMKIKPGAKQESLTELPYTEAAIAGICIHANIVQTMYSDLLPVFDKEDNGSFWSKAKDGPGQNGGVRMLSREERMRLAAKGEGVKEWQVRMVMEICDLGSVRDWVSHAAGLKYGALYSSLPAKAGTKGCGRTLCALLTALDVANGMKLLHKYKILHSDLKPHNVLLVSSHTDPRGFTAKLSDFGLSMKMATQDGQVAGIKYGTVQYLAPEVLSTHIMTKKADVFSFGIIMWEVWHSRLFAEFYNIEKKKRKAQGVPMDDYRPSVSSKCPHSFVRLMEQCLHKTPDSRPDFLGGSINIVVELERLIFEEYQRLAEASTGR